MISCIPHFSFKAKYSKPQSLPRYDPLLILRAFLLRRMEWNSGYGCRSCSLALGQGSKPKQTVVCPLFARAQGLQRAISAQDPERSGQARADRHDAIWHMAVRPVPKPLMVKTIAARAYWV